MTLPRLRLWDIFCYFTKLGSLGFGGPVALVGYMERDLVEQKRWLTDEEFQQGVALAAALPGPLAAQVAMWIGYLRNGFWGCTVASIGMIGPPFLLVLAISIIYVQFEKTLWIRALFYGIGPAVAALIAESCYRLARRYLPDWKMIMLALTCLLITVLVHAELALLFIAGGLLGILFYGTPRQILIGKPLSTPKALLLGLAAFIPFQGAAWEKLVTLCIFFFKAGLFTFGSGLAVAPFIHQGLVLNAKWLTERQFRDTVAIGMITPGPVVIMASFAGYLIQGVPGAIIAALGVFLPIYLMILFLAKYLVKHRQHQLVAAFAKGATAAAVGVISGAGIIVGQGVITDRLTVMLLLFSLLLIRWKMPGPLLVAAAGLVGLLTYP